MIVLLGYALAVVVYWTLVVLGVTAAAFLYGGAWVVVMAVALIARLIGAAWRPRPPSPPRVIRQSFYSDRR